MRALTGNVFNDLRNLYNHVKNLNVGGYTYTRESGAGTDVDYFTPIENKLNIESYALAIGYSGDDKKEVMLNIKTKPNANYGPTYLMIQLNDSLFEKIGDLSDYLIKNLNVYLKLTDNTSVNYTNNCFLYRKRTGEILLYMNQSNNYSTNTEYEFSLFLKKE